jgi:hypothetical protein
MSSTISMEAVPPLLLSPGAVLPCLRQNLKLALRLHLCILSKSRQRRRRCNILNRSWWDSLHRIYLVIESHQLILRSDSSARIRDGWKHLGPWSSQRHDHPSRRSLPLHQPLQTPHLPIRLLQELLRRSPLSLHHKCTRVDPDRGIKRVPDRLHGDAARACISSRAGSRAPLCAHEKL